MPEHIDTPRAQEPIDPWLADHTRTKRSNVCGWFALGIGALAWLFIGQPLPRVRFAARIEELELSVVCGIGVAVGVGLAIRALRLGGSQSVVWLALLVNVGFLVLVGLRLGRALTGQLVGAP